MSHVNPDSINVVKQSRRKATKQQNGCTYCTYPQGGENYGNNSYKRLGFEPYQDVKSVARGEPNPWKRVGEKFSYSGGEVKSLIERVLQLVENDP